MNTRSRCITVTIRPHGNGSAIPVFTFTPTSPPVNSHTTYPLSLSPPNPGPRFTYACTYPPRPDVRAVCVAKSVSSWYPLRLPTVTRPFIRPRRPAGPDNAVSRRYIALMRTGPDNRALRFPDITSATTTIVAPALKALRAGVPRWLARASAAR
jgi:hypothetical protein